MNSNFLKEFEDGILLWNAYQKILFPNKVFPFSIVKIFWKRTGTFLNLEELEKIEEHFGEKTISSV